MSLFFRFHAIPPILVKFRAKYCWYWIFCFEKNAAKFRRTKKNYPFRWSKLTPQNLRNTGFFWMKLCSAPTLALKGSNWPQNLPQGWNTSIWPILRRFRHPYEFQNDHFYPQMPSLEEKFILKAPFNASAWATTRKLQQDVENFVLYITEILFQKVFVLLIQIICALFFHLNDILYVCPQTFSSPGPAHLACLPQKSTYPIQTK